MDDDPNAAKALGLVYDRVREFRSADTADRHGARRAHDSVMSPPSSGFPAAGGVSPRAATPARKDGPDADIEGHCSAQRGAPS
jgi:hypothetical protein